MTGIEVLGIISGAVCGLLAARWVIHRQIDRWGQRWVDDLNRGHREGRRGEHDLG